MLTELRLKNYRGFREHKLALRPTTIAVGRNNAGKSTIVEALRILSIVTSRFEHLVIRAVPEWLEAPKQEVGVAPALDRTGLNLESLFNAYGEPPAEIIATFGNGLSLTVYLGAEARIHAVLKDSRGHVIGTPGRVRGAKLPIISTLPQLGPVSPEEKILVPEYVRSSLSTPLASLHFRNQLNLLRDRFADFKQLAEASWPGLRVVELQGKGKNPGTPLALLVKDSDFVAEIAWMGHGLQMWLQTMWFLTRIPNSSTVILDEPDVYMHPDLQRKLYRLVKDRFKQVLIATHSVEIMQEANAEAILVIDRRHSMSRYADSEPAVQQLVEKIGSISHVQLSRLWHAKKCILVEGEDLSLLSILHHTLFPDAEVALDAFPTVPLGGWSGWPYAIGSALLLRNAIGENIIPYCLLDSDFHTPKEISARLADATARNVRLHIWNRKEIENYLLSPDAIARLIAARTNSAFTPSAEEIAKKLVEFADALRDDVFDAYAHEFQIEDRPSGLHGANDKARLILKALWVDFDGRLSRAPGKILISRLSEWSQKEFGVSFGAAALARQLRPNEIPAEVRAVLSAITDGAELSKYHHEVVQASAQQVLKL